MWEGKDIMADSVSKKRRSEIMGLVKNKNTRPEIALRQLLHGMGYRFRLHRGDLPGRPDIVLPKWRTVVFLHGCFWHRHAGCPNTRTPKSKIKFWTKKFDDNVSRDVENQRTLLGMGWRVLVIWECEMQNLDAVASRVRYVMEDRKTCDRSKSSRGRAV
jgi:DNA mismatch endonuclease, patch repair protein